MKYLTLLLVLTATLFIVGCFEEEDSCNIRTPGIFVEYEIIEQGGKATAIATFWTGDDPGGTYLELGSSCGDNISVNNTQLKVQGSNPKHYQATINIADTYDITFERPDETETTFATKVSPLIPPVTILTPSGDTIGRDAAFDITWEDNKNAGEINLLISSDCFWDYPNTLGDGVVDNGAYEVPANALSQDLKDNKEGETCAATIELTRSVNLDGELHEKLKGTVRVKNRDTTTITSAPGPSENAE